jgi:predicted DNA-binding antitoxin AbrB/MazE fold protein
MAMKKPILAVYEDGSFKPLEPVSDAAEHERVYLMIETEKTLEDRIAESERLARESFEGLTDEQLLILEESALDQEHFFDRSQDDA